MTAILAAAAVVAGVAAAYAWQRWQTVRLRYAVLVSLKTGETIRGVLLARQRSLVIVGQAAIMQPGADPVPTDGTVYIDRANVRWIQRLER